MSEPIEDRKAIRDLEIENETLRAHRIELNQTCEYLRAQLKALPDLLVALSYAEQSLTATECTGLKQMSTGPALDKIHAAVAKLDSTKSET